MAEIQELTQPEPSLYVDSTRNPTDDIARSKTLKDLSEPHTWSQGLLFLLQSQENCPIKPPKTMRPQNYRRQLSLVQPPCLQDLRPKLEGTA